MDVYITCGVIFWLVCGVVAAMIGADKGEAVSGFVVGFVLGPLGVVVALLSQGNTKKCDACQKRVNRMATKCPYCQSLIQS